MKEVVLVVGAAGGIGQALVRLLLGRGAQVVATSRAAARLEVFEHTNGAQTCVGDARSADDMKRFFTVASGLGPVTGAVNLAGSILLKPAHLTSDEEFGETLDTNLMTAFNLVREAARVMRSSGGSIVLVSSVAARFGLANHEAIAAAKGAVASLALSAAATYAPQGIRINTVAPGLVQTPLTARLTANESQAKASTAMHPLRRLGDPGDVASAIAWLLNPAQQWVTGQHVGIDGGLGSLKASGGGLVQLQE